MSRGPDTPTLLGRALVGTVPGGADIAALHSTDWASATFRGARHALTLVCEMFETFDAWLERLPIAEFDLRGVLVADLAIREVRREAGRARVSLDVLTVDYDA